MGVYNACSTTVVATVYKGRWRILFSMSTKKPAPSPPDPLQGLKDSISAIERDIANDKTPTYVRPQLVRSRSVLAKELERRTIAAETPEPPSRRSRTADADPDEGSAPRRQAPQRPRRSQVKGMSDVEFNAAIERGEPF